MTLEEQLQAENQKLNARLQKAVTVFNEQKENIARLTAERNQALEDATRYQNRVNELENKLADKDADDTKFFEQLAEIDELKNAANEMKIVYDGVASQNAELSGEVRRLESEVQSLIVDKNSVKQLLEVTLKEKEQSDEALTKMTDFYENCKAKAKEKIDNLDLKLKETIDTYENRLTSLQDNLVKAEAKYNEALDEINALKTENDANAQKLTTIKTAAQEQLRKTQQIQELSKNLENDYKKFETTFFTM